MSRLLTTPNLISLSRVPMAALVIWSFDHPIRYVFFGIGALADVLDGQVARRTGTASQLGAVIDPVCDKLFSTSIFLYAFFRDALPNSAFAAFFIRDAFTLLGTLVVWLKGWTGRVKIKSRWSGKIVTAMQILFLLGALARYPRLFVILTPLLLLCSIWSVLDYGTAGIRQLRGK